MTMYAGGSPYFDEKSGTVNKPNMSGKRQLPKPIGGVKPVGSGMTEKRPLPKPMAGGVAGAMKPGAGKPMLAGSAKAGGTNKADALKQAVKFAKQRMGKM